MPESTNDLETRSSRCYTKQCLQIVNPALFITNILPESKTATFYTAEPSKYLNERRAIVPIGGCLGGGSSINFLVYVRPQEIDFDDWKTEG